MLRRIMKKRFKRYKDLLKAAIANTPSPLTDEENGYKNILILNGIPRPSNELVREAVKNINKG